MKELIKYFSSYKGLDISSLDSVIVWHDEDISFFVVKELECRSRSVEEFYSKCIKKIFLEINCDSYSEEDYKESLSFSTKTLVSPSTLTEKVNAWIRALNLGEAVTGLKQAMLQGMEENCFVFFEDEDSLSSVFSSQGNRYICFVL